MSHGEGWGQKSAQKVLLYVLFELPLKVKKTIAIFRQKFSMFLLCDGRIELLTDGFVVRLS
jgi:hypothetical protein